MLDDGGAGHAWYTATGNERVIVAGSDKLYRTTRPASGIAREQAAPASLELSPNPASDRLFVTAAGGALRIVDATGRVVQSVDARHAGSTVEIDVSDLAAGHYTVELAGETTRRIGRFIITR